MMFSSSSRVKEASRFVSALVFGLVVGIGIGLVGYFTLIPQEWQPTFATTNLERSDRTEGATSLKAVKQVRVLLNKTSIGEFSSHLSNLSESELIATISSSASLPRDPQVDAKQRLLLGTLARVSPTKALRLIDMFPTYRANNLFKIVFEEWCHSDFEAAVAAIDSLRDPQQNIALTIAAAHQNVLSDSIAETQRTQSLQYKEHRFKDLSQQLVPPGEAFELIINDDLSDYLQKDQLMRVLYRWQKTDGFNILSETTNANIPLFLQQELAGRLTATDKNGTLDYLMSLPAKKRNAISWPIVTWWGSTDGQAAFDAISKLNDFSMRSSLIHRVAREWAAQSPRAVLQRISDIPRKQRADVVSVAVRSLAKSDILDAVERLDSMRSIPGAVSTRTETEFIDAWARTDPTEALKWIQTEVEPGTERRSQMLRKLLVQYAPVDPEKAMELALLEQPSKLDGLVGLEQYVINGLVDSVDGLPTAIELLPKVRAAARPASFVKVGESLLNRDNIDEAIQIAAQLPEEEQRTYFRQIVQQSAYRNPLRAFETLRVLPSQELRVDVARFLLDNTYLIDRILADKQVKILQSFLVD